MGPQRLRASRRSCTAAALDTADSARCSHRRPGDHRAPGTKALTRLRRDEIGFIFRSFNLVPTLTRRGEHRSHGDRRPQPRPRLVRRAVVATVGSPTGCPTSPASSPSGQQRASRWPRAGQPGPRIVFADGLTGSLGSLGRGGARAAAACSVDARRGGWRADDRDGHPTRSPPPGPTRRLPRRQQGRRRAAQPTREQVLDVMNRLAEPPADNATPPAAWGLPRLSPAPTSAGRSHNPRRPQGLLGRKVRLLMSTFAIRARRRRRWHLMISTPSTAASALFLDRRRRGRPARGGTTPDGSPSNA